MTKPFDFRYYKPLNAQQKNFHDSTARHKLLIGGVGSGKTYPAIHEALFTCFDNPGCDFAVFRNTWGTLEDNIQKEFLQISKAAGCHRDEDFEKTKHDVHLLNKTNILFRPLTLRRKDIKGMNLCGFLIDDPDVSRFKDVISFLFTRFRDRPGTHAKYRQSIICANWEGKNWLWQTYMRRRDPGGNGRFVYWLLRTDDNPTLDVDYIPDLEAIHSKAWMDRYVWCNPESAFSGLVYEEYEPKYHDRDLSWCFKDKNLIKIMVIDNGMGVTCVKKMAADRENIYSYDEWYKQNIRIEALGEYLKNEVKKDDYRAIIIDPASAKGEQTSNSCVKDDLRHNFGIRTVPGINAKMYGIEVVKGLMTVRDGSAHWFIDPVRCPMTIREKEIYRFKDQFMGEFDEFVFKEEPVDKDDHAMDCERYGGVYLKRYLKNFVGKEELVKQRREKLLKERRSKLKMYREPGMMINDPQLRQLRKIHADGRYKYKYGRTMMNTLIHEREMKERTAANG